MNLMTKFAILVFMLASMMVVAMGIPAWAVATVDRNVVRNQGALVETLLKLKQIETASTAVLERERADDGTISTTSKFIRTQFTDLADLTHELAGSPDFRQLAGATLGTSLLKRLNEIGRIVGEFETVDVSEANPISINITQQFLDLIYPGVL